MLFSLSLKNIKKSLKDYSIYFFTLVVAVSIFYLFNSIDAQESMLVMSSSKVDMIKTLVMLLSYVSVFVSIILGFLIIYSNNFLIKKRKKEIGLYLTLGMSKWKVSLILVLETLIVGILSLIIGLGLGVILSQALSLFTAKLFEVDMSAYRFVFSSISLVKTIMYFGIIFFLVMIFNVITLSRYQLIDLLNASKKNERVKIRNKYIIIISFILTFVLLAYAYKLLFDGALMQLDSTVLKMILAGCLGTFLLFFSFSSVMLKIFQFNKKTYYKGLNMFVLRQINSKVNTSVVSYTIISLMLLLTIGILSGSMSMANAFNNGIKENNLADFSLVCSNDSYVYNDSGYEDIDSSYLDLDNIIDSDTFDNVSKYVKFSKYYSDDFVISNLLTKKKIEELKKEYGATVSLDSNVNIMRESDYNSLMNLFGMDTIDLNSSEYLLTANIEMVVDSYSSFYENGGLININGKELVPYSKKIKSVGFENYNGSGNDGVVIVSDDLVKGLNVYSNEIIGNYIETDDIDSLEKKFLSSLDKYSPLVRTKLEMEASSVGIKAIVTFIGLYLGIIFAISSVTVLAIGQLSESSDNKDRFLVLRKIGADDSMLNRALFTQIALAFLLPLVVALFHAFFGLRELNGLIQLFGSIDLSCNILITSIFIIIVYGGYFLATYIISKNIIKD